MKLPRSIWVPVLLHVVLFLCVILGVLPRGIVPFWTLAAVVWVASVRSEISVPWFVVLIPLFIAIPISTDFDNFNMWRPLALVIALRWFFSTQSWRSLSGTVSQWVHAPWRYPLASALAALFLLSLLSIIQAVDVAAGFRRVIFFTNATMVPFIAYALIRAGTLSRARIYTAIAWSGVGVIVVAFVQLGSTYLIDVYAFMRIWGEVIQYRQYGALWSQIVVSMGNTWLAYYGPQLSLRVFSLFPDSHSFPLYLLMALGGIISVALLPIWERLRSGTARVWALAKTRASLWVVFLPLGLLAVILSGTRGIWAASVGLILVVGVLLFWMKRRVVPYDRRVLFRYLSLWLVCYVILFAIAWPIFVSPQFLLSSGDRNLFANRLRSIVDFGETSNAIRLLIWKETGESIREHPLLGVGIGNYPVVLGQRVILAKAGSSAHNVWLHVAAEIGLLGFFIFCTVWVITYRRAWRLFIAGRSGQTVLFAGWMLIVIPWIAAYLLTDSALFDERTLILFGIVVAVLASPEHHD